MLKINLLPEEQRKAPQSKVEQLHRTPLMALVVAIAVALPILLWVPIRLSTAQLQRLQARIEALSPRQQDVLKLQRFLQTLKAQESALQELSKGGGLWARRLNIVSDATPEGVWFTELILDPQKGLLLKGSAIGRSDPGMVNVGRFVHSLKADAYFMSVVKDIQIESIKRVQDGDVEVMQFTVNCALLNQESGA